MKRKTIPKRIRRKIYEKYNGHCAYCGCNLVYEEMQVDHIIPKYAETYHGGNKIDNADSVENYNPSCRACNFYKGAMNIEEFRNEFRYLIGRLQQSFIFRLAVKYGLIEIKEEKPIKFYFEKLK